MRSRFFWVGLAVFVWGCSASEDGGEIGSADEDIIVKPEKAVGSERKTGTTMETTANLNLRSGPGTEHNILVTMPLGSKVTLVSTTPENGFFNVKYASQTGWASGKYLKTSGGAAEPTDATGTGTTAPATPTPQEEGNKTTVKIGGPAVRPHVQSFANAACSAVGCPYDVGTYNGHQPTAALAIDMMMSPAGTRPKDGGAHGQKVADYGLANAKTHKIDYVIWYQKINTMDGRGWRMMEDRGSITQNHYDHVHVSFDP